MIKFTEVSWQNLLSTGDNKTTVQLDRSPSTLIVGQNGAGKSTMLDALSFALFGKAHRDIKKSQLVNSINQKRCEVGVKFTIGNSDFEVIRGIKPNKFEIWQNGNQINQDSNARDFQKFLEQNILKLNHKSFHQIVVLGSSSFIPFMQLSNNHRREVIEDLLDINIFSRMNQVLKERTSKVREELNETNHQLDITKEKITLQNKYITDISLLNDEIRADKHTKIEEARGEIDTLNAQNADLTSFNTEHEDAARKDLREAEKQESEYKTLKATLKTKLKHLMDHAKFFDENDVCPSCEQSIDDNLSKLKVNEAKDKAHELNEAISKIGLAEDTVKDNLSKTRTLLEKVHYNQTHIHNNNKDIARLQKEIEKLLHEIENMSGGDIAAAQSELKTMESMKDDYLERKLQLMDKRAYYDAVSEMLKDTGIKTKIIKQYLPAMNQLINQYLQVLDFFVSFHIDENFNEVIKSRHRDDFNYASFSEGEKQRIDLALLFTWRMIARMKNSTATNLLVLDETFDSSLDVDGIENLMKILDTLDEGTNVFIISHKGDVLESKFRSKIEFVKEHNFSKIAA